VSELKSSTYDSSITDTKNDETYDGTHKLTPALRSTIYDMPGEGSFEVGTLVII
jgi:hypothetical protein